jgi:hypothetical protein
LFESERLATTTFVSDEGRQSGFFPSRQSRPEVVQHHGGEQGASGTEFCSIERPPQQAPLRLKSQSLS